MTYFLPSIISLVCYRHEIDEIVNTVVSKLVKHLKEHLHISIYTSLYGVVLM